MDDSQEMQGQGRAPERLTEPRRRASTETVEICGFIVPMASANLETHRFRQRVFFSSPHTIPHSPSALSRPGLAQQSDDTLAPFLVPAVRCSSTAAQSARSPVNSTADEHAHQQGPVTVLVVDYLSFNQSRKPGSQDRPAPSAPMVQPTGAGPRTCRSSTAPGTPFVADSNRWNVRCHRSSEGARRAIDLPSLRRHSFGPEPRTSMVAESRRTYVTFENMFPAGLHPARWRSHSRPR